MPEDETIEGAGEEAPEAPDALDQEAFLGRYRALAGRPVARAAFLADTEKEHAEAIERLRESGALPDPVEATEDGFEAIEPGSELYARVDTDSRARLKAGMRDVRRGDLTVTAETLERLELLEAEADGLPRGDAPQRGAYLIAQAQAAAEAALPFGEATTITQQNLGDGRVRISEVNNRGVTRSTDHDVEGLQEARPEAFKPVARELPGPDLTLEDAAELDPKEWGNWAELHPEEAEYLRRSSSDQIEHRTIEQGRGGGIT